MHYSLDKQKEKKIMFCNLAQIELKVQICPVMCLYRTQLMKCGFSELTDEAVDAQDISQLMGKKSYKVKSHVSSGKNMISLGVVIDRYSSWVRESFPDQGIDEGVNIKDSKVSEQLRRHFKLSDNQQQEFWSDERYRDWSNRNSVSTLLTEIKQALLSI